MMRFAALILGLLGLLAVVVPAQAQTQTDTPVPAQTFTPRAPLQVIPNTPTLAIPSSACPQGPIMGALDYQWVAACGHCLPTPTLDPGLVPTLAAPTLAAPTFAAPTFAAPTLAVMPFGTGTPTSLPTSTSTFTPTPLPGTLLFPYNSPSLVGSYSWRGCNGTCTTDYTTDLVIQLGGSYCLSSIEYKVRRDLTTNVNTPPVIRTRVGSFTHTWDYLSAPGGLNTVSFSVPSWVGPVSSITLDIDTGGTRVIQFHNLAAWPGACPASTPTAAPTLPTHTPTYSPMLQYAVDCRVPVYRDNSPVVAVKFDTLDTACYTVFPEINIGFSFIESILSALGQPVVLNAIQVPRIDVCFEFYDPVISVAGLSLSVSFLVTVALVFLLVRWGLFN
jgi:hypothetical protein